MASISFGLMFGGTPSISITSAVSLSLFEVPAGGSSDGRLAELKGEDDIVNTTHGGVQNSKVAVHVSELQNTTVERYSAVIF